MKRSEAREAAFKIIYSYGYYKDENRQDFYQDMLEMLEIEGEDYIKSTFLGTYDHLEEIDSLLDGSSKGWKIERMTKISKAIMRLCVYEMKYAGLPRSIAINEAVELAKKFDVDSAPSFVNGVVNMIAEREGLK